MQDIPKLTHSHPLISAGVLLLIGMGGFLLIGPLVGMLGLAIIQGPEATAQLMNDPEGFSQNKFAFLFIQGCGTFVGLFVVPLLYLRWAQKTRPLALFKNKGRWQFMVLAAIIVTSFLAPLSVIIEWNQGIVLPEALSGFYEWARQKEEQLAAVVQQVTIMNNVGDYFLVLLFVAVLPAIGEEFVFRGLVQNELSRALSTHAAIWIAACLFSAVHMQFFGFVPRLLLGALFGYLYVWSGSLWVPMVAHFLHNGMSVTLMYFYQRGEFDFPINEPEAAPWPAVLVSGVVFIAGIWVYKKITIAGDGQR